jgi:membrane fusion protein (multidrug efflux system)
VIADLYGSHVEYHGTIEGLGMGTGAAFALLPAQNATGNWIKVIQRVPVRIALDPREVTKYPLRVGLSTKVRVDIRNLSGQQLAQSARQTPVLATNAYDIDRTEIRARIERIIEENNSQDSSGKLAAQAR